MPFRRQHAGRFASLFGVSARSEEANGRPKRASNAMAISLRNYTIEAPPPRPRKSCAPRREPFSGPPGAPRDASVRPLFAMDFAEIGGAGFEPNTIEI